MMSINQKIINRAMYYRGQQEIPGNQGFIERDLHEKIDDKTFQEKMELCGWEKGQAWCAYFVELVWKEAYAGDPLVSLLDILFNAGALATWNNFSKSEFITDKKPEPGAIAIWQNYRYVTIPNYHDLKNSRTELRGTWQGHAGIVIEVIKNEFVTIEGNTNENGSREGIEVARKIRLLSFDIHKGLVLKGFIHPI